ncbi:hypothetical protein [Vibrio inusitatus]|nr:hypothetical protein [Vibrio inusitatus]
MVWLDDNDLDCDRDRTPNCEVASVRCQASAVVINAEMIESEVEG